MPRVFDVYMHTTVSQMVQVRIDDDHLVKIAKYLNVDVDQLTLDDLRDVITDLAYEYSPGQLDAQSSGWGQYTSQGLPWSRELNDEWDIDEDGDADAIYELTKQ